MTVNQTTNDTAIDHIITAMDRRFNALDKRVDATERRAEEVHQMNMKRHDVHDETTKDNINMLRADMSNVNWTFGILIVVFTAIVGVLIAFLLFFLETHIRLNSKIMKVAPVNTGMASF